MSSYSLSLLDVFLSPRLSGQTSRHWWDSLLRSSEESHGAKALGDPFSLTVVGLPTTRIVSDFLGYYSFFSCLVVGIPSGTDS